MVEDGAEEMVEAKDWVEGGRVEMPDVFSTLIDRFLALTGDAGGGEGRERESVGKPQ